MKIYKFRNCLLNTAERSVLKDNECLELTTRTFDVLQFLIEHAGEIVTKDELLGTVWNGNFVEESNLPVHISKLRRSLSETRDARYIETVQGTGYRFVAPVHEVSEDAWEALAEREFRRSERGDAPQPLHSIAVLPLENESGDPDNEYLTDGLTESLINSLSHFPNLRVIARNTVFRFRNKNVDVRELGATLGVSRVLTGRVRILNDNLIVGVELINADDGAQVWGKHYTRSIGDLVEIQEDISLAIAEKICVSKLGIRRLFFNSPTRDAESYRFYLKGKFFLEKRSKEDLYKAVHFFQESLAVDSENVHSYVEIVDCYRLLHVFDFISYPEFWQSTKPFLAALDNRIQSLDAVQVMYCDLRMLEWRFAEAALYCRRALAINPNSLKGRLRYSDLLLQSRNLSGALEQLEIIMTIDPLSPLTYIRTGRLLYIAGRYDDAIAYLNDALELERDNFEALALRGAVYIETGDYEKALANFEASLRSEYQWEALAMIGVVYAKQGNPKKSWRIVRQVEAEVRRSLNHSIKLAHLYLALGEHAKVFDCLDRASEQHEPDLRALPYDPRWESIRAEPRFRDLVRKVGLPS